MKVIKSKIHEYLSRDVLLALNKICNDVTIADNNTKVDLMVSVLDKYNIDYTELGPGTNRYAILIDGFVFKIAMDEYGIKDNWSEFAIAKELQPYVTKTYECNGLIVVAEYVTVISKEEFMDKKDKIRQILSYLAQGYIMGDVGTISKNFMNWGYRDDGQLVILDFAYIYKIKGDEMICGGLNANGDMCEEFLEYDENFYKLTCPKCRKSYTFYDIRRRIDPKYEKKEIDMSKQLAYQLTDAVLVIEGDNKAVAQKQVTREDIFGKEDDDMYDRENEFDVKISEEEMENMYESAVDALPSIPVCSTDEPKVNITEEATEETKPSFHINMREVLDVADEFYDDIREDIEDDDKDSDDEFYTDPENDEYVQNSYDAVIDRIDTESAIEDIDKPSTISETVTTAVSDELYDEYNEIKDDPECVVTDSTEEDNIDAVDAVVSSVRFITEVDSCEVDEDDPCEYEEERLKKTSAKLQKLR